MNPSHEEASSRSRGLPLADLRVLDLTHARAGPTAVRQFADWGADVIRIERPSSGDGGILQRQGHDFQNLHRNKRCLALDLKKERGREVFLRLVEDSDVLVENFRPEVKRRLRIDWPTLREIHPGLIYGSISGFGQTGPYASRGGVDQIAQGMSGLMSVTGAPEGEPTRTGAAITDIAAGLYLTIGILTALHQRQRTGRGQWVQTSLLEAGIGLLDFQAARYLVEGEVPTRQGNHHPTLSPMGLFPTADGFVNLAGSSKKLFRALCGCLGLDQLIDHPDYRTTADRRRNRVALEALVAERTRTLSTDELVDRLNDAGVPAGPVNTMDLTFADPQVQHLGIAAPVQHETYGSVHLIGQPVHLEENFRVRNHAPENGEHSSEILRQLGLDEDEISTLRAEGIVG